MGKKLRELTHIFLFPAKIRGKAIPQHSKIFELSNDIKLQLKEFWTSSWEVCPYCQTWALLSYRPGKPRNPPVTWLAVEQSCCLSSFFFKKEILLGIYLSSWICELYLSSLLKNCQSLFSSNMTSATSYFSFHIPFSMILYLFLMFSSSLYFLHVAWIISSDLSSSLLILSLAVSNCFQTPLLGICIYSSVPDSGIFRVAMLVSLGILLEIKIWGPDLRLTKSESVRVRPRNLFLTSHPANFYAC